MSENRLLDAALTYAARGWPVFPCGENKKPLVKHGLKDASTEPIVIRSWWDRWPSANPAIRTGTESGIVVVDLDLHKPGAPEAAAELNLPPTRIHRTPSGGYHYLYRHPGGRVPNSASKLGTGIDVRGDGGYVLMPPGRVNGSAYSRVVEAGEDLQPLPDHLVPRMVERERPKPNGKSDGAKWPEGKRNDQMFRLASSLRAKGLGEAAILAALQAENAERCSPPLDDADLARIAGSAGRYDRGHEKAQEPRSDHGPDDGIAPSWTPPQGSPISLAETEAVFQRWLHLPDPTSLHVLFGAVAANLFKADPLWLLLVSAPGGGKTEHLMSLSALPLIHHAATLTEASLLSGTPKRQQSQGAKGGLLRAIGGFGFLVCKDFTSVLSMNRDARAAVLAALREVYDGSWTRHVGTDGGKELHWKGKIGLLAGVTPAIDAHHAVTSLMGERFLMLRFQPSPDDERKQSAKAMRNSGREEHIRKDLIGAVQGLFAGINLPATLPEIAEPLLEHLVDLSTLVARCRSSVDRDPMRREIDLIPSPESPGRLAKQLRILFSGMRVVGVSEKGARKALLRVCMDSMPSIRRKAFEALCAGRASTTAVAKIINHPTTTTRRALEDLNAHHVLTRYPGGHGKSDEWELSDWARGLITSIRTFPEKSEDVRSSDPPQSTDSPRELILNSPISVLEDFSGTPASALQPHGLGPEKPFSRVTCITCEHYAGTSTCTAGITTSDPHAQRLCGKWTRATGGDDDQGEEG